jgi:hypothetical protein
MSLVPRYAMDMLIAEPTSPHHGETFPVTNFLLRQISVLDDMGAWEVNLRYASFAWFLVFALIRLVLGKRGGIDWYAMIHGILTGVGGVACAYLTFVSAESMTGTPGELEFGNEGIASQIHGIKVHHVLPIAPQSTHFI